MRFFRRRKEGPIEHEAVSEVKRILEEVEKDVPTDFYLPAATIEILRDFSDAWYQRFPKPEGLAAVMRSKLDSFLSEQSFNLQGLLRISLNRREVVFFMQVILAASSMGDEMTDELGIKSEDSPQREAIRELNVAYIDAGGRLDRRLA